MAMLGFAISVARPLRDLAVVSIASDNSSASSMWLALALIPLIFCPFPCLFRLVTLQSQSLSH